MKDILLNPEEEPKGEYLFLSDISESMLIDFVYFDKKSLEFECLAYFHRKNTKKWIQTKPFDSGHHLNFDTIKEKYNKYNILEQTFLLYRMPFFALAFM